ncbi:hypothetical protein AB0L13_46110, partial [Saccharopolyspora shandongensis]|uniref:hypothetical protein n=1 Tax=Saccharopolyspora shandongensis TaxID=418495 RepID=UPI003449F25A
RRAGTPTVVSSRKNDHPLRFHCPNGHRRCMESQDHGKRLADRRHNRIAARRSPGTEGLNSSTAEDAEHVDITANAVPINGRAFPMSTSVEPIDGGFTIVNLPLIVTGIVNISPDASKGGSGGEEEDDNPF